MGGKGGTFMVGPDRHLPSLRLCYWITILSICSLHNHISNLL